MRASLSIISHLTEPSADSAAISADDRRARQNIAIWALAYGVLTPVGVLLLLILHMPWHLYLALGSAAVAYAAFVVTPWRQRHNWPAYVYLGVACPSLAWLCASDWREVGFVFLLVAQVFAFVDPVRRAVIVSGLFGGSTVMLTYVHSGIGLNGLADELLVTSVIFGIAIVLVCYVMGLAQESQRRGRLIEQLERARADLAQAHHDAGVMSERERMSREIHDTLAQGFTSVLMLIQAATSALTTDVAVARDRLVLAADVARANVREAQALVAATAPADLEDSSLDKAIARVVERLTDEVTIVSEMRVRGTPRSVDTKAQIVLLRAAQETLANVRKHARASRVEVNLHYRAKTVLLEVTDDGVGFVPGRSGGFGLCGMRQRARQVNGTVEVISVPGKGTTVRVEVP